MYVNRIYLHSNHGLIVRVNFKFLEQHGKRIVACLQQTHYHENQSKLRGFQRLQSS